MVFVHSRKGTGDTLNALAEIAADRDNELEHFFVTQGKDDYHGEAYVRYADRRQAVVLRFTDQHGIRCRRSRTFTGHGAVADARRFLGKLGARERGEHPS